MFRIGIHLTILVILLNTFRADAASIKKTIDDSPSNNKIVTETPKVLTKKSPPAIVAIEIIDEPKKNSTGKGNSKRTIESSLGYGYNGPLNSYNHQSSNPRKKFVIYKYSQHDIPPQSNYAATQSSPKPYNSQTDIQKSIGYNLGTITSQVNHKPAVENKAPAAVYRAPTESKAQYYNQDNTFYTTFDQQGLGGISNQVPHQSQAHTGMVPVIFLKVYSNQLSNTKAPLYTNLPQSHPYADLNNINLQAYLQNYLQQYLQSQQVVYQPTYQQHQQSYQQPQETYQQPQETYQQPEETYQQPQQIYQQTYLPNYQVPEDYQVNLPTYENYPSKQHTRVVFLSGNNGQETSTSSTYKPTSYPMYIPPQQNQLNVETQQPNVEYTYNTDDQNSDQGYTYVYPGAMYQNVYYQDNNEYYEPNQNDKENTHEAVEETTSPPYNYHAHPVEHSSKDKRSKPSETEVTSTSSKQTKSRTKI